MLQFPPVVTRALGEEVAASLAHSLDEAIETAVRAQAVPRDEYRTVLSRLDIIEHDLTALNTSVNGRLDRVDARLDALHHKMDAPFDTLRGEMDARFDTVHAGFNALRGEMDARFDTVHARFDALQSNFDARLDAVNARLDGTHEVIRSQTRWLIGTLIAIGGLISALITVFEFIR